MSATTEQNGGGLSFPIAYAARVLAVVVLQAVRDKAKRGGDRELDGRCDERIFKEQCVLRQMEMAMGEAVDLALAAKEAAE